MHIVGGVNTDLARMVSGRVVISRYVYVSDAAVKRTHLLHRMIHGLILMMLAPVVNKCMPCPFHVILNFGPEL